MKKQKAAMVHIMQRKNEQSPKLCSFPYQRNKIQISFDTT